MTKEIESSDQWHSEFREISQRAADARNLIKYLWPSAPDDAIRAINSNLTEIETICENLKYYFCQNSLEKWLMGRELTREEFYLLAAHGIWLVPSLSRTQEAHEEFAYYLYEDNDRKGYINPSQRPNPPPVPMGGGVERLWIRPKLGVTPEDVRIGSLKAEQKAFFEKHSPDLFARFRKD